MIIEATAVPYSMSHLGGGETYPWRLFNALDRIEDVRFVSSFGYDEMLEPRLYNVDAYFLKIDPFLNEHNPIPSLLGMRQIKRILQSKDVEFLHIHNLRTISSTYWLLFARLCREHNCKIILTDHGSRFFPFPRLTASIVNYYAAVSEFSATILNRYSPKPTFVIPPIIPDKFVNGGKPPMKDIDIIIYGRIAPWKRQDLAIKTVALLTNMGLRDIKVVIAGGLLDNRYYSALKNLVAKNNLSNNINFEIGIQKDKVPEILARSKIMLALSWNTDMFGKRYRLPELSSAVILEAAAVSTPVIASDIEPFREIISDGENGYLVDPSSIKVVAEKSFGLLSDKNLLDSMGKKARIDCLERNSEDKVVGRFRHYIQLIREGAL